MLLTWGASGVSADVGIGDDALPGLIRTDTAESLPRGLLLALSSGYGFTGAALVQEDSHHRGAGRLGRRGARRRWRAASTARVESCHRIEAAASGEATV